MSERACESRVTLTGDSVSVTVSLSVTVSGTGHLGLYE